MVGQFCEKSDKFSDNAEFYVVLVSMTWSTGNPRRSCSVMMFQIFSSKVSDFVENNFLIRRTSRAVTRGTAGVGVHVPHSLGPGVLRREADPDDDVDARVGGDHCQLGLSVGWL